MAGRPQVERAHEGFFGAEGNALVDRGGHGSEAIRIAQIGWNFEKGSHWPQAATSGGLLRWSRDGGRTWTAETAPRAWRFEVDYKGRKYTRSVSEGFPGARRQRLDRRRSSHGYAAALSRPGKQ